jgi:hypothetical protein
MNKKYISILLLLLTLLITLSLGSYNFIKNIRSNKDASLPMFAQYNDNAISDNLPTTTPIIK